MLKILVVEDDSQLAQTLKYLVEDNPRYRVVATADDAEAAIAAAEAHDPDLVLLDLHLAHGTTGFSVAVRLSDMGVPCLFVSGKAPRFPMPGSSCTWTPCPTAFLRVGPTCDAPGRRRSGARQYGRSARVFAAVPGGGF